MKVICRASFLCYVLVMSLADYRNCIALLCALSAHEASHYLVAVLIREPIEKLELTPFGGIMQYKPGHSSSKGIKGLILSLAGPLGNYLFILLISGILPYYQRDFFRLIINANLSMLMINLIPALPLDGGSAIFSIGYYFLPVSLLIRVLCGLGLLSGSALFALSIWGLARYGTLNLTLMIVGAYLAAASFRCTDDMLAQNMYALLQERKEQAAKHRRPIKLYRINGHERLYEMTSYMGRESEALFIQERQDGTIGFITEELISQCMLKNPLERVMDSEIMHAKQRNLR